LEHPDHDGLVNLRQTKNGSRGRVSTGFLAYSFQYFVALLLFLSCGRAVYKSTLGRTVLQCVDEIRLLAENHQRGGEQAVLSRAEAAYSSMESTLCGLA